MSSYKKYYHSDDRQVGKGVIMLGLGIAACCVPGGQAVGVSGIIGGVTKIAITSAKATYKAGRKKNE